MTTPSFTPIQPAIGAMAFLVYAMICAGVGIAANIQVYAKILIHLKPCALLRIFRTAIQISLLQLLS